MFKRKLSALSGVTFAKTFTTPKAWSRWVESAVGAHLLNLADEHIDTATLLDIVTY